MVSLTRWIWVRASSRSWWWTRKLGVLQPMELQRVRHDWATDLIWMWTDLQRHHFANKGLYIQSYGFSRSHVWMWELDHKVGWAPKNWCFWTVMLEKTLESPLDSVNPKGNQPWIFIGRTDAENKAPIFDHLTWRANSLEKTLMLGKTEGRRRRGWQRMRWLDSITDSLDLSLSNPGDTEGQGSLACCSSQGHKE